MDRRSLLLKYIYLCTEQVYNYKPLIILTVRFIDKKKHSLCTQNHQELYSLQTHSSRGQSVLQ